MKKSYLALLLFIFSMNLFGQETGKFTDLRDGNEYEWVKIGDQTWMAENLAYLPQVDPGSTASHTRRNYYVYGYYGRSITEAKASDIYNTFGVLYNWIVAVEVCPDGWHLPSDGEWRQLEMHLGMSQTEADTLGKRGTNEGSKLAYNSIWWANGDLENNPAFGSSGFKALPGGCLLGHDEFVEFGASGYWWSATDWSDTRGYRLHAWTLFIDSKYSNSSRLKLLKVMGLSVRCIKDP